MAKPTKEVFDLIKSGNFTIAYHDNGDAYLYKGKHKYENLPEEETYYFTGEDGYIPEVVSALVSALGGKTVTI